MIKTKCSGCNKRLVNDLDGIEEIFHIDHPLSQNVDLCRKCYNQWFDVPKGYKLEVNPSTGGLWYRPLSKNDKKQMNEATFFERWMTRYFIFAGIILVIGLAAFISDLFGLGIGDDIRRITWHIYNPFSDSINPYL